MNVRIPPLASIENALKVYYNNLEIGNEEMTELFGSRSRATLVKLKKVVLKEMIKRGVYSLHPHRVRTDIAFEVWEIDISDLEKRWKKLTSLKL